MCQMRSPVRSAERALAEVYPAAPIELESPMKITLPRLLVGSALVGLTVLFGAAVTAAAASSVPVKLHDTRGVMLDAPVATVWARLGQFGDLSWIPAVRSSTTTKGNSIGSTRSLDFGGAIVTETLVAYSDARHSYSYKIDATDANRKLVPASTVIGTITVSPTLTGGSVLTWSFEFRRLDWSATPERGADDEAARKQIAATLDMGIASATELFPNPAAAQENHPAPKPLDKLSS